MEKNINYHSLIVTPKTKQDLHSLMVYFDSTSQEECFLEMSTLLSKIFGGLQDECVISVKTDNERKGFFDYDCYIKGFDKHIDLSLSYLYGSKCIRVDNGLEAQTILYNKYKKERNLILLSEEKRNEANGNFYKREYSDYGAKFTLKNGDYTLVLDTSIHTDKNREELIINKNEEKLEQYLLNLEFPINIYIVHVNICKILDIDLNEIPNYTLKFTNKNKKSKHNVDTISYGYGKIQLISRDENGKTLIITEDGFKHIDRDNNNEIIKDENGIVIKNYYTSQKEMSGNDHFIYNSLNHSVSSLVERLDNPAEKSKKNDPKIKKITPYDFD